MRPTSTDQTPLTLRRRTQRRWQEWRVSQDLQHVKPEWVIQWLAAVSFAVMVLAFIAWLIIRFVLLPS
jgi:hypothetical protein